MVALSALNGHIKEGKVSTKMGTGWYQVMPSACASHRGRTVHLRQKIVAGFVCVCCNSPQVMQASRQQHRERDRMNNKTVGPPPSLNAAAA